MVFVVAWSAFSFVTVSLGCTGPTWTFPSAISCVGSPVGFGISLLETLLEALPVVVPVELDDELEDELEDDDE